MSCSDPSVIHGWRTARLTDDHTLKVWDLESGEVLATFTLRCCCALLCICRSRKANCRR